MSKVYRPIFAIPRLTLIPFSFIIIIIIINQF